ncbi:CRISPR-associated endonuclease Cas1 [Azospirillum lipoferum]|nr:CRISPR-associated endonuclease Cas1 [Azospirillum lipoferum]
MPLYVQQPGARVGRKGDLLVSTAENEPDREVPIGEVSELVLSGPVSLSPSALHALVPEETPIAWMSSGFWFMVTTGGRGPRSVHAREAQYAVRGDAFRRLLFARDLVRAKLRNQRTILRRNWRATEAERDHAAETLKRLAERTAKVASLPKLLGVEGEGAVVYFPAFPSLFTDKVAGLPEFGFDWRSRRPPADPVNACLSLCYSLLARTCATALEIAGLDPWAGLYHADRPGRPALVPDLMEPQRPIPADSTVLMGLNNGELSPGGALLHSDLRHRRPETGAAGIQGDGGIWPLTSAFGFPMPPAPTPAGGLGRPAGRPDQAVGGSCPDHGHRSGRNSGFADREPWPSIRHDPTRSDRGVSIVGDAILEARRPFCEGSGTHENADTARICQVVVRTRLFDIVKNE